MKLRRIPKPKTIYPDLLGLGDTPGEKRSTMPNSFLLLASFLIVWMVLVALLFRFLIRSGQASQVSRRAIKALPITEEKGQPQNNQISSLAALYSRVKFTLSFLETDEINQRLLSADWKITGTELFLIQYGGAVFSFFVLGVLIFNSVIPGLGFGILTFTLPSFFLRRAIQQRSIKFENQLLDVLILVRGAVGSGYSLLQSLDVVIRELPPPASQEFERVKVEVGLGLTMSQALSNLLVRRPNEDLRLMVTAFNINAHVGGQLSHMLDAVISTLRDRMRILGEVRALTSYARYSSYLLSLLPFGLVAIMFIVNPNYVSTIFQPGPYLIIPIISLILIVLGNIWIRRAGTIDV